MENHRNFGERKVAVFFVGKMKISIWKNGYKKKKKGGFQKRGTDSTH